MIRFEHSKKWVPHSLHSLLIDSHVENYRYNELVRSNNSTFFYTQFQIYFSYFVFHYICPIQLIFQKEKEIVQACLSVDITSYNLVGYSYSSIITFGKKI